MKRTLLILLLGLIVLGTLTGLVTLRPEPSTDIASASPSRLDPTPRHEVRLTSGSTGAKAAPAPNQDKTERQPSSAPAHSRNNDSEPRPHTKKGTEVDLPLPLQQPLREVAAAYKAQSQYPAFSQPIRSSKELLRYKPHQPQTVSLPFPTPDGGTYLANLTLDRYQYFMGDAQQLELNLSSSSGLVISNIVAEVTTLEGEALYRLRHHLGSGTRIKHRQSVDLSDAWQDWPVELQWRVRARVGEQRLAVVAPFRYETPVAMLEALGQPRIEGEFLTIPLQISTHKPGYYFVQANLYSQSGRPLLHLQAEGPLTPDYPPLELQASSGALKSLDASGPYLLRDIQLVRMGDDDNPDQNGRSRHDHYPITGFPFNEYAESTWSDPLGEQRQEFLESLGGG